VASYFSSSLRSTGGRGRRASTTAYTPPSFTAPALPTLPSIDDGRLPDGGAGRAWIGQQLGQLPGLVNPRLTNIRAGAQQSLAGYGGWKFREDDPSTPEREDLILDFDGNAGPGEREKQAVRGEQNATNARGMLESSFTNQNIGQALQRLSLEAQAIANQYAKAILDDQTSYANQVSQLTGQWVGLYGSDSAWLLENPPPTPPNPEVAPDGRVAPASGYSYDPASNAFKPPNFGPEGPDRIVFSNASPMTPQQQRAWMKQNPGYVIRTSGPRTGNKQIAVRR
jgi:hypothetical protein